MNVYLSHDIQSSPHHPLMSRLSDIVSEIGHRPLAINYADLGDPTERARRLGFHLAKEKGEFLLSGIGMGAYVSLVAAEKWPPCGIFLIMPAIYMPGYPKHGFDIGRTHLEVVHGWQDDAVPTRNSFKFSHEWSCPLHLIPGCRDDEDFIDRSGRFFQDFLLRVTFGAAF